MINARAPFCIDNSRERIAIDSLWSLSLASTGQNKRYGNIPLYKIAAITVSM